MEYRRLGRTGLKVSSLCLGTMMFGEWGNPDHDDSIKIIRSALDAGINFIDTADMYSYGESEEIVAKAVEGRRDEYVIATKFANPMGKNLNQQGSSRRWIIEACEQSLRRLGTDYIDLYQVHRVDPQTDIDETLGALSDLVHQGKVRYLGTSKAQPSQIVEAQWGAERRGRERFVCEQPPYSMLVRGIEAEVLPTCERYGIGVITWGPLGNGWLSGRWRKGVIDVPSTRAHRVPERYDLSIPANQVKLDATEALAVLAAESGLTLIHLAIAFVLHHHAVTSAIIGPRTAEHLDSQLERGRTEAHQGRPRPDRPYRRTRHQLHLVRQRLHPCGDRPREAAPPITAVPQSVRVSRDRRRDPRQPRRSLPTNLRLRSLGAGARLADLPVEEVHHGRRIGGGTHLGGARRMPGRELVPHVVVDRLVVRDHLLRDPMRLGLIRFIAAELKSSHKYPGRRAVTTRRGRRRGAAWPPSTKHSPSGVRQWRATLTDGPTTATTTSSRPASSIVRRNHPRVSIRPVRRSTRRASWCSQPAWFSSEPRWWSTVKQIVPPTRGRAQVDRRLPAVRPDLEQGTDRSAFDAGLVQGRALVVGHEPDRGACRLEQNGIHAPILTWVVSARCRPGPCARRRRPARSGSVAQPARNAAVSACAEEAASRASRRRTRTCSRTAGWGFARISRASASAAAMCSPTSTSRVTMPACHASSALNIRPVIETSFANAAWPRRGSRDGIGRPTSISVTWNRALRSATRRSQWSAVPSAWPRQ